MKGRPKLLIRIDQLQILRELNFSWLDIANILGVSHMTLYCRRCELGLSSILVSDEDLR